MVEAVVAGGWRRRIAVVVRVGNGVVVLAMEWGNGEASAAPRRGAWRMAAAVGAVAAHGWRAPESGGTQFNVGTTVGAW